MRSSITDREARALFSADERTTSVLLPPREASESGRERSAKPDTAFLSPILVWAARTGGKMRERARVRTYRIE